MAQLKLTPADVARAVREQNAQFAAGKVGQAPISEGAGAGLHGHDARAASPTPKEFEHIIVRAEPGRLDAAPGRRGARRARRQGLRLHGRYNGKPAT